MLLFKHLSASSGSEKSEINSQLSTAVSQLINRRNADGSFSFKGQGGFESIWLTASAVKCLSHVRNFTAVNETIIESALIFLKKHQQPGSSVDVNNKSLAGSFIELGSEKVKTISLTAFVTISFLEGSKNLADHEDSVKRALDFISRNTGLLTNNLEIAMSAYMFSLAKYQVADDFLIHLRSQALTDKGKKHWRFDLQSGTDQKRSARDRLIEVEIAAYAVLAYIEKEKEPEIYPIMLWMVEQVNGGNLLIKDTIVTFQALAQLARISFSSSTSMRLIVTEKTSGKKISVGIDKSNAANPIYFNLPNESRDIEVHAKGTGLALLEMSLKYNELARSFSETFSISITVETRENENDLRIVICAMKKFKGNTEEYISDDLVMQVELPRG